MNIEENGKVFVIENGRVVEAKKAETAELPAQLNLSDRVEYEDRGQVRVGTVVSLIPSLYGTAVGVEFEDDRTIREVTEGQLRIAKITKTASSTDINEEWTAYCSMPEHTKEQIRVKQRKAQELNNRAKAITTDKKLPLDVRVEMDRIVTATYVDVGDLKKKAQSFDVDEADYLDKLPKYQIADHVLSGGRRRGDISWVATASLEDESMDDKELVALASSIVDNLTENDLRDETLVEDAINYRSEGWPPEQRNRLVSFVNVARQTKAAATEPEETPDVELEDVAQLFL